MTPEPVAVLEGAASAAEAAELDEARWDLEHGVAVRYGVGPGRVAVCESPEDVVAAQRLARRGA